MHAERSRIGFRHGPLDKYELYLEEARRDLVGQNSLFRDLDQKARNASVTTLSLMGLTALLLRTSAEVHSLAEVAGLVAGGAGLTTLITSLVALRIRDFDSAPMTDLGLETFDQPNWKPTNLRKWLGKRYRKLLAKNWATLDRKAQSVGYSQWGTAAVAVLVTATSVLSQKFARSKS